MQSKDLLTEKYEFVFRNIKDKDIEATHFSRGDQVCLHKYTGLEIYDVLPEAEILVPFAEGSILSVGPAHIKVSLGLTRAKAKELETSKTRWRLDAGISLLSYL